MFIESGSWSGHNWITQRKCEPETYDFSFEVLTATQHVRWNFVNEISGQEAVINELKSKCDNLTNQLQVSECQQNHRRNEMNQLRQSMEESELKNAALLRAKKQLMNELEQVNYCSLVVKAWDGTSRGLWFECTCDKTGAFRGPPIFGQRCPSLLLKKTQGGQNGTEPETLFLLPLDSHLPLNYRYIVSYIIYTFRPLSLR